MKVAVCNLALIFVDFALFTITDILCVVFDAIVASCKFGFMVMAWFFPAAFFVANFYLLRGWLTFAKAHVAARIAFCTIVASADSFVAWCLVMNYGVLLHIHFGGTI